MDGPSPYNKRIELTARGRHVFRMRESRAGDPPRPSLPGRALRPCSQLIRAMEVMSPDDPERDKDTKREEYARAGIPEYWLIDVVDRTMTVFCLRVDAGQYAVHGVFRAGERVESPALVGFGIEVQELFAAGNP
jgi:hypothetical protein